MATSGISRNYDLEYYCCTICEKERSVEIDADFYCKKCLNFFCRKCINSHNQHGRWFKKKSPYGKDKIRKWPLSKKMETSLLTCVIHKVERLTMYCPDHSQLCCSRCVELNHRLCLEVTPLSQAARGKSTNFKNLSVRMENTLSLMKQCQTYQEDIMMSLKVSCKEHERLIVDGLRVNIVSYLRECETSTVNTTHEHMQYPISEMREEIKYLLADFEKSTIKEEKKEELNLKQAPLKVVRNSCIRLHYELFNLHVAIPKVLDKPELSFIASKKCLENIQQSDIFIKENFPIHVFTVNGKSVHNVKMPSDSFTCEITAVCALPNGQVLVADYDNNKIKLLNQQYRVVRHLYVRAKQLVCRLYDGSIDNTADKKITKGQVKNEHQIEMEPLLPDDRSLNLVHEKEENLSFSTDNLTSHSIVKLHKFDRTALDNEPTDHVTKSCDEDGTLLPVTGIEDLSFENFPACESTRLVSHEVPHEEQLILGACKEDDVAEVINYTYDAFVFYNQDDPVDKQFVLDLIEELEGRTGLRLYVPGRDDHSDASEHINNAGEIERRCRRVIIVLSSSFLQSTVWEFQEQIARAFLPDDWRNRLITMLRERDVVLPEVLEGCNTLGYNEMNQVNWILLTSVIRTPRTTLQKFSPARNVPPPLNPNGSFDPTLAPPDLPNPSFSGMADQTLRKELTSSQNAQPPFNHNGSTDFIAEQSDLWNNFVPEMADNTIPKELTPSQHDQPLFNRYRPTDPITEHSDMRNISVPQMADNTIQKELTPQNDQPSINRNGSPVPIAEQSDLRNISVAEMADSTTPKELTTSQNDQLPLNPN
ncbi:uncharacterized protein LOC127862666 isoform X4 [Dreissena polymorpha]|uniref:uncharacterized protein LOC127862666 isoform X3 n=1 Tax=Dreissena polymorpha TaxID=45954 RepID=UPI002264131F|nr:uncharacterized protein LOC127862666 isoform X3 [Dreissena polymorpha]XP_052257869.1 uncharacterized protein LOC127862666 isoform X4 [Dreissena polymorpha]